MKILIIDDEIDLSLLLKNYLAKKGHEVTITHTLGAGLESLNECTPDILFLDNNLPDGEGWKEAYSILSNHPGMHLFLISAYHPEAPEMADLTNYTVLEKPISFSDLDQKLAFGQHENSKSTETEQL